MLSKRFIDIFKQVSSQQAINAQDVIYKKHPIFSELSNDAFEIDMLNTVSWQAFNSGCYVDEAALVLNGKSIYMLDKDSLTERQKIIHQNYYADLGLTKAKPDHLTLYIYSAIKMLCFNNQGLLITPIEYRNRLNYLEESLVVLNFVKMGYASLVNPNRKALYRNFKMSSNEIEVEDHQIDVEITNVEVVPS